MINQDNVDLKNNNTMDRHCWCGNQKLQFFSTDYLLCSDCQTLILQSGLSNEELLVKTDNEFYGKNYWLSHQLNDLTLPTIYQRAQQDLPERCVHWLKTILKYKLPSAKSLELGCAHGGLVGMMRFAGYDATGLEMSPWITQFAIDTFDIPVLTGPIEDQVIEPESFDIIVMMDVLEHLPNPSATIQKCLSLLKPDGIMVVQTPEYPSGMNYEDMQQSNHRFLDQLKAPEHIYLFSANSVQSLFKNLGAPYVNFEPAVFAHYDMYFIVSKSPLPKNSAEDINQKLCKTSQSRLIQALIDAYDNQKICYLSPIIEEVIEKKEDALNILIYNDHFPEFPGTGGYEFLNTINLTEHAQNVGLISMLTRVIKPEKTQVFANNNVKLYLWKEEITAQTQQPQITSKLKSTLKKIESSIFYVISRMQKLSMRPADTRLADFLFRNMSAELLHALNERKWQVFTVIQSSNAAVIDYLPPQPVSILIMHDIRSLVFKRRAKIAKTLKEYLLFKLDAWRYYNFEKKYIKKYDIIVALSKVDAQWIQEHYQPKKLIIVPVPVDISYYNQYTPTSTNTFKILFTGLMNHPPNIDAVIFFAKKVFPIIKEKTPHAEFLIVGKHPVTEVTALALLPGITVTGEVPDIRPYLAQTSIFVVPLRFGSGVRQKILEAWSMKKCVVSTAIGAEGLTYINKRDMLIIDDPIEMANQICYLMENDDLRQKIGQAGYEIANTLHNPKIISNNYYGEIENFYKEKINQNISMRVLIDLRWMYPGSAGGIEHYAKSFLKCLAKNDTENFYTVFLPHSAIKEFTIDAKNFKFVSSDMQGLAKLKHYKFRVIRKLCSILKIDLWQTNAVPILRSVADTKCDIAFSITGYINPMLYPLKNLLSVPDIQHEYFPEFFSKNHLIERKKIYLQSIHHAEHIIAISNFTKQTLIEKFDISPEKITTVHLAADSIFTTNNDSNDSEILAKYNIKEGSYLFFPAHTWPHKNHKGLLEALSILRKKYQLTPLLICTGGFIGAQDELNQKIKTLNLQDQVRFLGHINRHDLPTLYRCAASLVYPSLFEGFGMPVLEAMSCGCPVICSNTTSLPEIAEDAALQIDPNNYESIADAIYQLLNDNTLKNNLIEKGFIQAQKFSWEKNASQTLTALLQVHQNKL